MKIAMFTNTYLPQVSGVATSVHRFSQCLQEQGHDIRIIAPTYSGYAKEEKTVFRVPSLQKFNGTDFSFVLPMKFDLVDHLDWFRPDIIHSHHPFMLGNTAARYSSSRNIPLMFTHHTMYEYYTHYVPVELEVMKEYIVRLSTGYANLCDALIAPSESIQTILKNRGIVPPIYVVPTGVDIDRFSHGVSREGREHYAIPTDAQVIGFVGRLAPEKNLVFLSHAVRLAMENNDSIWFLIVGHGPSLNQMKQLFQTGGVEDRVRFTGDLRGQNLCDAYHAMDAFVFASKTETQGMVLIEALATGCPVIALDAPGAREVVQNGKNGILVTQDNKATFARAIEELVSHNALRTKQLHENALDSARAFSTKSCAHRLESVYNQILSQNPKRRENPLKDWNQLSHRIEQEWNIWSNRLQSMGQAIRQKTMS